MKEKRRFKRIKPPNIALAAITGENVEALVDSGVVFGKLYDINPGGAAATVPVEFNPGDSVNLMLRLFKMDLKFMANVIHSQKNGVGVVVGLQFDWDNTEFENQILLKKYLEVNQ